MDESEYKSELGLLGGKMIWEYDGGAGSVDASPTENAQWKCLFISPVTCKIEIEGRCITFTGVLTFVL